MDKFMNDYSKKYSDNSLWEKFKSSAQNAGIKVIYVCLLLYYALQEENTPLWAKSIILGALGYFILPLDVIPDLAPVVGYTDDLGTLLAALETVSMYINEYVKSKAKTKLHDWFGDYNESEINDI